MLLRAATRPGAARKFGRRIKWRLAWILAAFGLGFGSTFWYRQDIFAWLIAPADGLLSPFPGGLPVFTAPTQMFGASLKLAAYGGVTAVLPVAVVGVYTLISPIFTARQRRLIWVVFPTGVVLFGSGIAFVYYVMLPVGLKFLLNFGDGVAVALISITQYMELLTQLMFWMGVIFELPLLMVLAVKLRVMSYKRLLWLRRLVPPSALILGIILTPGTDLLNMVLVAAPIVVLYEVGLFAVWISRRDEGDYMFIKAAWHAVAWVLRKVRWFLWWSLWPLHTPFRYMWRGVRRVRS